MSRVAVLMPVYNQTEDLMRTLRSVDRERGDFEFFIVDDGSDEPVQIEPAEFAHPVHLIRLPENKGCTVARNVGLQRIFAGDFSYVALQDAGDLDIGERMSIQADFLDTHPEIAVVGSWAQYVAPDGERLYVHRAPASSGAIRARMRYVSAFAHPASMIRISALQEVGCYDDNFPIASDYEMFFRLTKAYETANLQQILIHKVEHPNSLSLGKRKRSLWYRLRAQMRHFSLPDIHSYLGVTWTVALLLLPYRFVTTVKRWRGYAS